MLLALAKLPLAMVSSIVLSVSKIHLYDTVYVSILREIDVVFRESLLLRYGATGSHWRGFGMIDLAAPFVFQCLTLSASGKTGQSSLMAESPLACLRKERHGPAVELRIITPFQHQRATS